MSTDRYSNDPNYYEIKGREGQHYTKEVRHEINFSPSEGEILHTYIMRTAKAVQQLDRKAWSQHVEGNRTWYCHKNIMGCFICQHTQFLHIFRNAFKDLSELHSLSDYKFTRIKDEDTQAYEKWSIIPI